MTITFKKKKKEKKNIEWHSYRLFYVLPQVTRVHPVFLAVRVFLEHLVWLTKLKDSQECLVCLDGLAHQAILDPKVKVESLDSPGLLDQG